MNAIGVNKFEIDAMPQSLVQIYVHLVFSTKNRAPYLRNADFRERVHAYLAGICNNQASPAVRIGGVEDHVHILTRLSKTLDISTLIRELKRDSSKWIKDETQAWQISIGKTATAPFRSVRPMSIRSWRTSTIKSNITGAKLTKTSSAVCARNMESK